MSMLSESRSRQKWSQDPRNTNWSQDKTKFGYQMLTKMGWSEGNGLGQNLTGNVDHVRVKKRETNLGIGVKKSHDDDWIAHQDDFNALLASLNGKESDTPTSDIIENKTNSSKFRYTKFVKSKDLSSASSQDLACIFGQRSKSSPKPPPPCEEPKREDDKEDAESNDVASEELSVKTVESSLSMSEYFAQKMAALKQKTNNGNCPQSVSISGNNDDDDEVVKEVANESCGTLESVKPTESEGKKKKKKKKKVVVADENVLEYQRIEDDKNENCILGKRKKESEIVPEEGVVKKKKKKKREERDRERDVEVVQQVETIEVTKKKKKKKKKEREQSSD